MTESHPQHIMAKPPVAIRRSIARLEWTAAHLRPENLHWTVLPDPEVAGWSAQAVAAALGRLEAAPFTLVFDQVRARAGGSVEIRCRRAPPGARQLVAALCGAFARAGIAVRRKARPHVTLDYAWQGPSFDAPIDPIVWDVDRIMLIESVIGQGLHRARGEWPLVPRQGLLFPLTPCDPERIGAPGFPVG
jgi:2'-5' RNA ligase